MREFIVVIEDNADVRRNICEILRSEDYEVEEAENGTVGLDLIKRHTPDLVLCDIMMPEMDGFEVLNNMRNHSSVSSTPFVFLTAKTAGEDMSRGMEMGADDYIMKPFTIDELLNRIRVRLDKRKEVLQKSDERLKSLTDQIGLPIAKELNAPLKAIIGLGEMILSEGHAIDKSEIIEFVSLMHKGGLELKEIVGKTLTYYDLESMEQEPQRLATLKDDTTEVKDLVTQLAYEEAEVFGRELDLVMSVEDMKAKAPKNYLIQMLKEVINNAFKFSPKGTIVKVLGGNDNENLHISVSDEGVGLSEEEIVNIGAYKTFKDLEQLKGIGLGLQNAKRIAQLFDGSFHIDSHKGLGTTIKIALPLAG